MKKWIFLFWTTLLVGAVAALLAGMYLQAMDQSFGFLGATSKVGLSGLGFNMVMMAMGGLMFSVISQMGFFAYLTVNYIAISIIRKKDWWILVQLFLIVMVLFELAFLRYLKFGGESDRLLPYFGLPVIFLVLAIIIAYWKMKLTNRSAFIPTLFFIFAATILEAVPALQQNNFASTLFMAAPLFLCNTWQILMLHKLVSKSKP